MKEIILRKCNGITWYIDQKGIKRWKFSNKKGAIYGHDERGRIQRWN